MRRAIDRSIGEFRRDNEILDYADLDGEMVLDYGCGAGETKGLRLLTEDLLALGGSEVVGIDISDVEIERARARIASKGLSNVRFIVGDAHATGLADEPFDVVIGGGILHHLDLEPARFGKQFAFWERAVVRSLSSRCGATPSFDLVEGSLRRPERLMSIQSRSSTGHCARPYSRISGIRREY